MATLSKLVLPVKTGDTITMKEYNLPSGGSGGSSSPEEIGIGYGICSTAYATSAKTATLEDYELTTNGIVAIRFTNAVNASATLSINGEDAKPIFYRGIAIVNGIIKAGDTATLIYDGTNYNVLGTDNPWRAEVRITSDPNEVIRVQNETYNINDTVSIDSEGHGVYICKAPGTYVFSTSET